MNRISPTLSSLGNTEVALADLMDEVARLLQAGQPIDVEALTSLRPELADPLRLLLPAIQVLVGLGESGLPSDGAVEPGSPTSFLGVLGDFRIVREIGRGGMGVVYEAEQISLGRRVALKVLPFAATLDTRQVQRFKIEAQAAGCLHHTNIVPVHAVGQERGVHYYAMQLIAGRPLTALICELSSNRQMPSEFRKHESTSPKNIKPANGGVTVPIAALTTELAPGCSTYYTAIAELGIQAAEALEFAHQQGVIHRDIKPGNLLIDERGRLWVTDFGLAHVQANASLTMSGGLIGTLRYMSPEQALAGHPAIDHRTDVYSLGMTLYELLTLEPAFDGRNREQLLNQIALTEPRPLRQLDRRIPVELETIVLKAIAKEPGARYASAADLADDLRRFRDHQPIRACPPSLVDRIQKWGRRHRQLVGAAWVFLTIAIVGLSVSTYLIASKHTEVVRERDEAGRQRDRARQTAEENRGYRYVYHIAQAFRAWQAHDHEGMLSFLERQRPGPEQTDLRSFDWGLLHRLARLTPHPERTLRGHNGEVYCVAFAPDGSAVASAGMDGKVHFWNPITGEKGPQSLEHRTEVNWVAYSPSGKLLATACDHGLVVVWDVATGRALHEFKAHPGKTVDCVAFSADETLLASTTVDRELRYWSVGSYQLVTTLPREATGQFVAFAPDGNSWCTANGDVITLWDWKSKASRHVFHVAGKVLNVQYSHDSRILAAAGEDGIIRRWQTVTGQSLPDLVHGSAIQTLAFSPDDRTLASAGDSSTIRIWDLTANSELAALSGHRWRVWCLAYSPDGNMLTSCGHDQSIQVWQPARFRERVPLSLPAANPSYAAFTPDCQSLISQNEKGDVNVWDVNTGQLISKLPIPLGEIGTIASSPTEPLLALCRVDETIQLWNLVNNKPRGFLEGSASSVFGASFSPDGKRLAVALSKGLAVWNVATGRREKIFLTAWQAVRPTFSPDSKLVAGVCDQGTVGVWNVETGAKVANLRSQPLDSIGSLAFSPDGALLAVGIGATVKLWDVESGVERTTLVSNEDTAGLQVAFSPDGRTLASHGDKEGKIIIWSVATGQETLTLDWNTWPMWALLFSPDGQALVAAGGAANSPDHPAKLLIWRADPN